MLETLLATIATFGSPMASPVPSIAVVSAIVTADEIARTDDLPTLGDVALLPDGATSNFAWHLAAEFRRDIDARRSVGVNGLDDVLGEAVYRQQVWDVIADASNPSWSAEGRRRKLATLRCMVGDHVYFAGAWPAPCPFINRPEVSNR